jgi:guanine deaminase
VTTVVVDGRVVMRDRVIQTVDEAALRADLARIVPDFRADADKVFERTARLRPYILEADKRIWREDVGIDRYLSR